jgi:hypothetical protein
MIVSGGQTGVDRAALDAAMACGLPVGGWCPAGRRAEDGAIDARYPLQETPLPDYAQRTAWNVRDSDGTLVLTEGLVEGGTARTLAEAAGLGRPALHLDLRRARADRVVGWMEAGGIRTLNVAGPRASEAPGIYGRARAFLEKVFRALLTGAP